MSNHRTIEISLDHIVAEIVALPIVGREAYRLGVDRLDSRFVQPECQKLWRFAERDLLAKFPHTSIDELICLRNLLWFPSDTGRARSAPASPEISLTTYIRHVAHAFLVCEGSHARPRLPDGPGERHQVASGEAPEPAARRAWRWLTFALPSELLLAGLARGGRGPTTVEVVTENVAALLDSGYAETHLHYGVAFDFSMGWAAAVNVAGRSSALPSGLSRTAFRSPGADHEEGDGLAIVLLRGAAVRYLLGRFLHESRMSTVRPPLSFDRWLDQLVATPVGSPTPTLADAGLWKRTVREVFDGQIGFPPIPLSPQDQFLELQDLYNRWGRLTTRALPQTVDQVQTLDPLSEFFPARPTPESSVQLQFLWAGFEYLDTHPTDSHFTRLFWQVERIRCHTYRHCIQRPLVPGLTNFIRFYERKSMIAGPIEPVLIESAALLGGLHHGLASLEVRTSPRRDRDSQQTALRDVARRFEELRRQAATGPASAPTTRTSPPQVGFALARSQNNLETGLVIHFLKIRGSLHDSGRPQIRDTGDFGDPKHPSRNPLGYRWEGYFRDRRREADALTNALAIEPELLRVVRGIDVCRDEPGVPIWIIAPLFEHVHSRVREIRATYLARRGEVLPILRTTVHVGEDFVHLASGLRAMDDAVDHLKLRGGDRVGHGLALGVEPLSWARRTTRLAMPREDRWFNLLWEWKWHADRRGQFAPQRRNYLEHEIVRLAHDIFDNSANANSAQADWSILMALEFYRKLHDLPTLVRLGFPDKSPRPNPPIDPVDRELERFLWDPRVFHNARTVEWVESAHEGETLHELQRLVRQRYADLGITIEVNPISNLLVGDLTDLTSHPLWRLAPKWGDQFGPSLRMCVGSDDPFPFATNLREEYQFLYDSLILAGKSPPEARDWLDLVRQMGWESRFTR